MSQLLPTNYSNCAPCCSGDSSGIVCPAPCPEGVVPGPQGESGTPGTDGTGINAFTTVAVSFIVPNTGDDVTVVVGSTAWMAVGQFLYIQSAGFYQVSA